MPMEYMNEEARRRAAGDKSAPCASDCSSSPVPKEKWRCASMHDPSGRRGIWFAVHNDVLIVRGGREGDDAWAEIPRSMLPQKEFDELVSVLKHGACQQEDYGPDSQVVPFADKRW